MPVDRGVLKTKPKRSNCLKKVPGWDTVVQCTKKVHAANMEEESPPDATQSQEWLAKAIVQGCTPPTDVTN